MSKSRRAEGFSGQRIVVLPCNVVRAALACDLLKNLLPTDVGYFPKAAGHFIKRAQGIDQAILIYCVKGIGWCEIEGTRLAVNPSDVLVIPPGCAHAYGADGQRPWTIFWVHVKGQNIAALLNELRATPANPVLGLGENPELLALFEELLEVIEHGYDTSRLLYASQILAHLIGLMIWDCRQIPRGPFDTAHRILESINYMKQHLDHNATAASFAALANLSESHYRSLFKTQIGYAPMDYFIRLRMHKACQLLDTTSMSVKEIAAKVGYEDPLYFSRIFRSVVEHSPSQYRLMNKG